MWHIITAVALFVTYKIYVKILNCHSHHDAVLTGKVVIITGGSFGVGYKAAKDLAARGAKVILGCRDLDKGRNAQEAIIKVTGNKNVAYRKLDLASLESVRRFVKDFKDSGTRLDILINNAGAVKTGTVHTNDDIVESLQVNYLGGFLLTVLLVPILKQSGNGRIVNVSSILHRLGKMDLEKINCENVYNSFQMYCNSKFCNILFTKELAKRLSGTGVIVNSVEPGFIRTKTYSKNASLLENLSYLVQKLFLKSSSEGAQTLLYLALSDECEMVNGKHFSGCRETTISDKAEYGEMASKLWKFSEETVRLKCEETIM
ncbi:hypothetical protein EVAR_50766_1 [Eumeta japonica]|uniref:Retinol dehydrogenase 11 n=1 Tax=Eumeta variegata TaxID=151549 RepID=A0A4C1WWB3_EUMVA|nr:hypothetical protein EVAR_50766_1 [Eumeta japonica]